MNREQKNEPELTIAHCPIALLVPWPNHARKHNRAKRRALASSIRTSGLINPIIIDEEDHILSGHLRVDVYRELGFETIAVVRVTHMSAAEKSAYVIAANRFPENGTWDRELLRLEMSELVEFAVDLDLEIAGFETGEIDLILQHDETVGSGDQEIMPDIPKAPVSRPGDLWILQEHLLLCGDSLDVGTWSHLMGDERARLCFTDPPFNVRITGHVSSKGHDEFAMASGEMSAEEFTTFLRTSMSHASAYSLNGALHYIAMDHRHLRELYVACDPVYSEQLNLIVWAKTNAGMGSLYRSRHELFALYKSGTAPHINNVQLGRFGRNRSNVWSYPGANTFRKGRDEDLADHPTVKPTDMVADAILDTTHIGDIVIDGFSGSGTLILAAEQTNRRARAIEIDPKYVDVAIRRWEAQTALQATLLGTNETFEQVRARRSMKLLADPATTGGKS